MGSSYPRISGVDLFCGVGGLSEGLSSAGIEIAAGIDNDPACEFPFQENQKADFVLRDVRDVQGSDITKLWARNADFTLLAGCAPCQPFSTLQKANSRFNNDARWDLLLEFERLIVATVPTFVTMENVPGIQGTPVLDRFINTLERLGYHTDCRVLSLTDFNLPQSRKRFVLIASKIGPLPLTQLDIPYALSRTAKDVISQLPELEAGEQDPSDPLHRASRLSPINLKRIIQSKPGGTWRDWEDQSLVLTCHRKSSGKYYASVYGRMDWEIAPTITTQFFNYGTGRFGHPVQNRALSLREGALLQGFPSNYVFSNGDKPAFSTVGRLVGNAVPPPIGKAVGEAFVNQGLSSGNKKER